MDQVSLSEALAGAEWYAVAAIVLSAFLQAAKRMAPGTWERIPRQARWLVPVGMAAVGGFVEGYAAGVTWDVALFRALASGFFAGVGAIGSHSVARDIGASTKLPPAGGTAALVLCLTGCEAHQPRAIRDLCRSAEVSARPITDPTAIYLCAGVQAASDAGADGG